MKKVLIPLLAALGFVTAAMGQNASFKKAYVNHTEIGLLLGNVRYVPYVGSGEMVEKRQNLTVQMFNGLQLSRRLAAGVTVGMDRYTAALVTPIMAGVRYDLTRKENARFFASADAGYGFTWFHSDATNYHTQGGLALNPGLGLRFGKPAATNFTLSMGYKYQQVTVDKPPFWTDTERTETRLYNRLALRLGLSF
ncbi:hypothetical protein GCM10027275_02170 [Rhabdobacter roseus]|uniref:Outer membrane protein beta-barrel domain-containing protein n=1 Tax=Rhabdobacter roseus TaxID=1655419 RepID=A0A840TF26_9BACT|nr:hypothetical protein [Rhabdobacter roseus]MBB5282104.1 hypothetical protein [Rhabdobacter roseus]